MSLRKPYPWLIWSVAVSFFFYKYLIQVSPGVMSNELMSTYQLTGAGLGNLAACFFYAYMLMQIPSGLLLDRLSPKAILFTATSVCAISTLVFAFSDQLLWASASRFMMGLGGAFACLACFKLITLWFPKNKFSFMAGLSTSIAMLGAVGGELPLAMMVEHFSWRGALQLVGLIGLLIAVLMLLVIPARHAATEQLKSNLSVKEKLWMIAKNKQTWLLSLYSGLAFAPVSVFGGLWGVSFLVATYGITNTQAAHMVSMIFIGFAAGSPIFGWLSERCQQRKGIMAVGTFVAWLCLGCALYLPLSAAMIKVCLFVFGFGSSCFLLCFTMISESYSLLFSGTVLGIMNTFDSLCEAITEPVVGYFLDKNWDGTLVNGVRAFSTTDYQIGLSVLTIYLGLSLILLCFIKETFQAEPAVAQDDLNQEDDSYVVLA